MVNVTIYSIHGSYGINNGNMLGYDGNMMGTRRDMMGFILRKPRRKKKTTYSLSIPQVADFPLGNNIILTFIFSKCRYGGTHS